MRFFKSRLEFPRRRGRRGAEEPAWLDVDLVAHAREHAEGDYTGPALDEPGAQYLHAEIVSRTTVLFRSHTELRDAQQRFADAEVERAEAERRVATSAMPAQGYGAGVEAEAAGRDHRLARRRFVAAADALPRLDAEALNLEHRVLEEIARQAEVDLAVLRRYVVEFNNHRRRIGLDELGPLPDNLVQEITRAAVQPVLGNGDEQAGADDTQGGNAEADAAERAA